MACAQYDSMDKSDVVFSCYSRESLTCLYFSTGEKLGLVSKVTCYVFGSRRKRRGAEWAAHSTVPVEHDQWTCTASVTAVKRP